MTRRSADRHPGEMEMSDDLVPPGDEPEEAYWRRRADEELERAKHATTPEGATAHQAIAQAYLARAEQPPGTGARASSDDEKDDGDGGPNA